MMFNLSLNQNNMSKYNKQLSSGGKRIFRPSDDPVGISRVLKYTSDIHVLNQFKSTIGAADGHNNVTESAVKSVKEILQTIRQHAVAAADHTKTPEDIKKYAIEIEQLKKELMILGNATNGSKYVFSGLETDKQLFVTAETPPEKYGTYNLLFTTEMLEKKPVMEYEVTVGEVMRVGVHPADLFGVVPEENPMTAVMPRGGAEAVPAKRAEVNMKADATKPYNGSTIKVALDGADFTVDTSELTHTHLNPMNKTRFLNALASAENAGGVRLGEVADVFYDEGDRLVIRHREAGAGKTIAITHNSPNITDVQNVPGVNAQSGVYDASALGGANLSDANIAAAQDKRSIVVYYKPTDKDTTTQAVIELDFAALNSVADLKNALQAQLNAKIPPAGTVSVTAADGQPLKFTVAKGEIRVDSIVATKSKMIDDIDNLVKALNTGDYEAVNQHIAIMDKQLDTSLAVLGEIGGKTNRLKYIEDRIAENTLTFSDLNDKLKYADFAELITLFKNMENVYRASLAIGSKVIQPSLVDFIR